MLKKIFQSAEERRAKVALREINLLGKKFAKLSDEKLKAKTDYFKNKLQAGATLDELRNEAFAVAREATSRVLKKRPFDVQMLGGLILNVGSVAEMKTGEGKTITSIAPIYLNALPGNGVIVSTVNEYLTQRDAEEMGAVYNWLGLSVGINLRALTREEKQAAYNCDITYSVHSEIGFDYLRDNMVKKPSEKVMRGFNYALIDEVDSILIDEAKTPLIISGGTPMGPQEYERAQGFAAILGPKDYVYDAESKGIQLSEEGIVKANKFFATKNIFSVEHSETVNRIHNALRANFVMSKDVDYIVRDNKILIVDAFTGRVMEGRSYSDGLHQAIQAKEKVEIEPEMKTMATITYQNLFRMFKKLCGMSGTAKTEENEFIEIYNMRVHEIPTNLPIIRIDHPDEVYVSKSAKYKAMIKSIKEHNAQGQPILIGTEEVSESEKISQMLKKAKLPHIVLNAKQNKSEADIVAAAGKSKSITVATNMAGRGTDIKLDAAAKAAGGLYVIGTNKAESRRIDNQLKGRSGRQGDIGESRFFLSLEDTLISRFSNQAKLQKTFSSYKDKKITGKHIARALNKAQVKIEGFNFESRKNVLQYDDIIRQQRDLIYAQRDIIIKQEDLLNVIQRMMRSVAKEAVADFETFKNADGSVNIDKMCNTLNKVWLQFSDFKFKPAKFKGLAIEQIVNLIQKDLVEVYDMFRENIEENITESGMHDIERDILLSTFDQNWQLHIDQLSKLKSNVSLVSYAQQNPFQIYVQKGSELFQELLKRISHNTIRTLMNNAYVQKKTDLGTEIVKKQVTEKLIAKVQ